MPRGRRKVVDLTPHDHLDEPAAPVKAEPVAHSRNNVEWRDNAVGGVRFISLIRADGAEFTRVVGERDPEAVKADLLKVAYP